MEKQDYYSFDLPASAYGLEDEFIDPGNDPNGNPNGEDDDDEQAAPLTTDQFKQFERFYKQNIVLISIVQFLIIILLLIRILNK
jgi:hypothetical protein